MRKVIMFNSVSVDGYFAGPNGEIDWLIRDPELGKALHEIVEQPGVVAPGTVLLGRVTYQLFESIWPKIAADPKAPKEAQTTAEELNQMTKNKITTALEQQAHGHTADIFGYSMGADVALQIAIRQPGSGAQARGSFSHLQLWKCGTITSPCQQIHRTAMALSRKRESSLLLHFPSLRIGQ